MMKTLIFNGSPRKHGGTSTLISEITKYLPGEIHVVSAYYSDISSCVDCRYCWTHNKCAISDGMQDIYKLIDEADNIIIASPIYVSELTGNLLGLMSRLQYFWAARYFKNIEILSSKKRNGAVILVDGGEGFAEQPMSMAKTLLKKMRAEFTGSVYFSGTENKPIVSTAVPDKIIEEIKELAEKLKG